MALFNGFWKLGDFDSQNVFLARSVKQHNVQRRRIRPKTKTKHVHPSGTDERKKNRQLFDKAFSRLYYVNVNGQDVQVCKEFFVTFDISSGRLNRALKKQRNSGESHQMMPGVGTIIRDRDFQLKQLRGQKFTLSPFQLMLATIPELLVKENICLPS